MKNILRGALPLILLCTALPSTGRAAPTPPPIPAFKKVVLVIFENQNYEKALSQSVFADLAKKGALLTKYHAISHPSLPNYLALISGDTQGIDDDAIYNLNARHIGDLLEEKGKTWKNYAEDYPGNCYLEAQKGRYARKHTPFLSFTNITKTPRCNHIVDATQFLIDLKNNQLPDFSFYTPNMDDDGHDTQIAFSAKWFDTTFLSYLKEPGFKDVLLIVTFDENSCPHVTKNALKKQMGLSYCEEDSNQVYTVLYGPPVKAGAQSELNYDHYSLLHTIEMGLGLGNLGKKDANANIIKGIWK